MALSDLELLQLVEAAKEKQKGPKGDPGVGIDRVEQFDNSSFTLRLTDGSFKKIELQPGQDGPVGPIGIQGERGEPGPAGRPGNDGAAGTDGKDGLPGRDGSYVDTAVVNGNGHLLLGLSDGQVIDVGRVVGPVGATGERGATGLPGEPGVDGAAVLSGPRAPQESDGEEGDHWIDISSAEFCFYKKSGNGWTKLANLRQPAQDRLIGAGVGGGNGNGGGGKSEPQNTRTLPLVNGGTTFRKQAETRGLPPIPGAMESQEDANLYILACLQTEDVTVSESLPRPPYAQGQLWFCTNPEDLTLYIYDGAVWVPAAPPVSLDGIESSITGLTYAVEELKTITVGQGQDIAAAKSTQYSIANALKYLDEGQERQDNQIIELEEEIESLAPTFDRGEWAFVTEQPAAGQYAIGHLATSEYCLDIVGKCLIEAGDDDVAKSKCNRLASECETAEENGEAYLSDSWGGVDTLKIHKLDAKGKEHGFGDWSVGKYVELFNHDDEGYGLFVIDEAAVIEADVATFKVHHVAHEGKPTGVARAKVFEMGAGDPTDFVRKAGDTMEGALEITGYSEDSNPLLKLKPTDTRGTNSDILKVYGTDNTAKFWVTNKGDISAKGTWKPSENRHLSTKEYVDNAVAARRTALPGGGLRFKYGLPQGDPSKAVDGLFYKSSDSSSGTCYVSRFDLDGVCDLNPFYGAEHDAKAAAIPGLEYEKSDDPQAFASSSVSWDLGAGLPLSFYQQRPDGLWKLVKTMNVTKVMMLTSTTPLYCTFTKETRYASTAYTYTIITLPGFF